MPTTAPVRVRRSPNRDEVERRRAEMEACARPAPDHPDAPSRAGLWVAAAGGVALVASGVLFAVASHYRGVADGQAGDAYERNVDRMNRAQKAGFLVGIAGLGAVIGGLVYHF